MDSTMRDNVSVPLFNVDPFNLGPYSISTHPFQDHSGSTLSSIMAHEPTNGLMQPTPASSADFVSGTEAISNHQTYPAPDSSFPGAQWPTKGDASSTKPPLDGRIAMVCALWRQHYPVPSWPDMYHLFKIFNIDNPSAALSVFEQLYKWPGDPTDMSSGPPPGYESHFFRTFLDLWRLLNPREVLTLEKAGSIGTLLRRTPQEVRDHVPELVTRVKEIANITAIIRQIERKYSQNQHACRPGQIQNHSHGIYKCTNGCGASFSKLVDWKKHEAKNWWQVFWCCRLEGCNQSNPLGRAFRTKGNYQGHRTSRHKLWDSNGPDPGETMICIDSRFPKRCGFLNCGVSCNYAFQSWSDRFEHIKAHYEANDQPHSPTEPGHDESDSDEDMDGDSEGDSADSGDDNPPYEGSTNQQFTGMYNMSKGGFCNNGFGIGQYEMQGNGPKDEIIIPELEALDHLLAGTSRLGHQSLVADRDQTALPKHVVHRANSSRGLHGDVKSRGVALLSISVASAQQRNTSTHETKEDCPERASDCLSKILADLVKTKTPEYQHVLSHTNLATVDRVSYMNGSYVFARKIIHSSGRAVSRSWKEAGILRSLDHPNIVRHLAHFEHHDKFYLLMYPAAEIDLLQFLRRASLEDISTHNAWDWFAALASGLEHIHSRGFRHRDIKPSNILVHATTILIADFGLSNVVDEDRSDDEQHDFCTKRYAAPELRRGRRGRASDIWSLGCVFLELISFILLRSTTSLCPIETSNEHGRNSSWMYAQKPNLVRSWLESLVNTTRKLSKPCRKTATEILGACKDMMRADPSARPTAGELVKRLSRPSSQPEIVDEQSLPVDERPRPDSVTRRHSMRSLLSDYVKHLRTNKSNSFKPKDFALRFPLIHKNASELVSKPASGSPHNTINALQVVGNFCVSWGSAESAHLLNTSYSALHFAAHSNLRQEETGSLASHPSAHSNDEVKSHAAPIAHESITRFCCDFQQQQNATVLEDLLLSLQRLGDTCNGEQKTFCSRRCDHEKNFEPEFQNETDVNSRCTQPVLKDDDLPVENPDPSLTEAIPLASSIILTPSFESCSRREPFPTLLRTAIRRSKIVASEVEAIYRSITGSSQALLHSADKWMGAASMHRKVVSSLMTDIWKAREAWIRKEFKFDPVRANFEELALWTILTPEYLRALTELKLSDKFSRAPYIVSSTGNIEHADMPRSEPSAFDKPPSDTTGGEAPQALAGAKGNALRFMEPLRRQATFDSGYESESSASSFRSIYDRKGLQRTTSQDTVSGTSVSSRSSIFSDTSRRSSCSTSSNTSQDSVINNKIKKRTGRAVLYQEQRQLRYRERLESGCAARSLANSIDDLSKIQTHDQRSSRPVYDTETFVYRPR